MSLKDRPALLLFAVSIAPPKHLVFEALGATGRVVLSEVGGQTQMTVRIECGSAAQLDEFVKMGVAVGTSQTLDNLVEYLSAPRAQSRT